MTREEIIADHPIVQFLRERGVELKGQGNSMLSNRCAKTQHKKQHWCVTIDSVKQLWHCNDCDEGGTVIDWVMSEERLDFTQAMAKLSGTNGKQDQQRFEVAWYDYTDENGTQLFQVVRYLPKTFRQRHKRDGKWVYDMQGVRRVLYRLKDLIPSDVAILTEGEKDCDNLRSLGFVATCNPMGAGKWLESYSETLKGKRVYVWPDNDEAGRAHCDLVVKSLLTVAKAVYLISVNEKDASDFISVKPADAKERVDSAIAAAKLLNSLESIPVLSFLDLELEYQEHVKTATSTCLDLSRWLPSLRCVRPLVPGELASIIASTGIGKTAILQNIAIKAAPLVTLIFELELPGSLMFERFCQIDHGFTGDEVFESYRDGTPLKWGTPHVAHLFFCMKSKISAREMEGIIDRAELIIGKRPALVMVDYIGLMDAKGSSRYERVSEIAENLKVISKSTNTIVIFASQIARKDRDSSSEIFLHDAKDSGSVENSSGLVIGVWREGDSGQEMIIKVLKNTKGFAGGKKITCNFEGKTLRISERSNIREEDIPIPDPRGAREFTY